MPLGIVLTLLPILAPLGTGPTVAQDASLISLERDGAYELAYAVALPEAPVGHPSNLITTSSGVPWASQVEEEEPGSFILGAVVGAVIAAAYLSNREGGDGEPLFPWVPIGAFFGGMITWSAGIG